MPVVKLRERERKREKTQKQNNPTHCEGHTTHTTTLRRPPIGVVPHGSCLLLPPPSPHSFTPAAKAGQWTSVFGSKVFRSEIWTIWFAFFFFFSFPLLFYSYLLHFLLVYLLFFLFLFIFLFLFFSFFT